LPKVLVDLIACLFGFQIMLMTLPWLEAYADTAYRMPPVWEVAPVALIGFPYLVLLLSLADLYEIPKTWTPWETLRSLVVVGAVFSASYILARMIFPERLAPPLRAVLVATGDSLVLLWLLRTGWPQYYSKAGQRRRMLLVGANTFGIRALQRYAREHPEEVELVGVLDDFKSSLFFENLEIPYYGRMDALPRAVETHQADVIVVLLDQQEYSASVVRVIETHPSVKEVFVRAQIPLFMAQDIEIFFVQELPLLKVFSREGLARNMWLREALDRALAMIGLVVTLPVMLITAALIKLESPGPVFYRQKRLGLDNRPFWIYKFRSMVVDAERISGAVLAQKNDPRVTRTGRFMRATRVDEIPQLINVLKGEMSLVGPRPERPEFTNSYLELIPWYPLRSLCKPGITGLAQVTGDYHTSTQRKLLYDVSYLANISPLLDLRILLATVVTVLTKKGH
jgi:exopolysaccharide biosynthesis polyprenyl glycosylphosphotransferase